MLQEVLRVRYDQGKHVRLSCEVHQVLAELRWLVSDLTQRPMRIAGIIPKEHPDTLGSQDYITMDMGGVHFVPHMADMVPPLLWRCPFPEDIPYWLVAFNNRIGDINNIELELTESVAQHDVLAQQFDIREVTIHNSLGTIPLYGGSARVPQRPMVPPSASFSCKPCTNVTINIFRCSTT
jgi:hypothetical protein